LQQQFAKQQQQLQQQQQVPRYSNQASEYGLKKSNPNDESLI
jgi:hypothetical protein